MAGLSVDLIPPEATAAPTSQPTSVPQSTATVMINISSLVIERKSTMTVKVTLTKGDSVKKWESSNTRVATVSQKGKIKALKAGKTVITVKSGTKVVKVKVTVEKK